MEFDHLGVATDASEELADLYTTVLDATVVHEETREGLAVTFLDLGGGYLELLEPVEDAEETVSRFLERRGPGLHHLAVHTPDIEATLGAAREYGLELIDDRPRAGAWDSRIAFVHPRSTGGVLLELVER